MPIVLNLARSQDAGPAKMVDRMKNKTSKLRTWYDKRAPSCLRSVVQSEDSATPIDDFLAYTPGVEFRRSTQSRKPQIQTDLSPDAQRNSQYREFGYASNASIDSTPTVQRVSMYSQPSDSASSLSLMHSMGSTHAAELPAHQSRPALPRPRVYPIDTPDDLYQYRSDLQPRVELESIPAVTDEQRHPRKPSFEHFKAASSSVEPRPRPKSFVIDTTPVPVAQDGPYPRFKPYPGDTDKGPAEYQAYPGLQKRKPTHEHYIPPSLQSGYKNGVPPSLHATHRPTHSIRPQDNLSGAADGGKNYSYPFVDRQHELFVNANMSETNISSRYQEPRIQMEFSGRGLEADFHTEINRRNQPHVEKEVVPSQPPAEKEVVRPQSRAWMSPSSPLSSDHYEMEASFSEVRPKSRAFMSTTPPMGRYEMDASVPVRQARAVTIRPKTPRIVTVFPPKKQEIMSPVSPMSSSNPAKVNYSEFNWPRFSDHEFVDPAQEWSQSFRQRRRELRKERPLSWSPA